MIQQIQYDENACAFVMHDFVQSLAEFVAGEAFRSFGYETFCSVPNKTRYLSVLVHSLPTAVRLASVQRSTSLRALQVFNTVNPWLGRHIVFNLNAEFFHNLRSLRVLNFTNTGIRTLPDSIGNLKLLRFLGLSRTKIEVLPESICFLYNLQTLDLSECPLQELPKGITNLVNLQHLIVEKWSRIQLPHGIGQLTNLQTLIVYNIRRGSGCKIYELSKLNKLRGELHITGLDNIQQHNEQLVNLLSMKYIHTLILDWSHQGSKNDKFPSKEVSDGNHELVLEALQPQLNLEVLELYSYRGLRFPRWLGDPSYSKLVKLVLFGNNENGYRFLPTLGHLPSLQTLSIQCILTVESVGYEFHGYAGCKSFPSLKFLEFKNMPNWRHWFEVERNDFSSLDTLMIVHCGALRTMPDHLSSSLRKLVVNTCGKISYLPILPSLANLILMGSISNLTVSNLNFPSLKSLEIGFCKTIKTIRLQREILPSLEELVVKGCTKLRNLCGFGGLHILRKLELDGLPKLHLYECIPPSLQVLKVTRCRHLQAWELDQQITVGHKFHGTGTERHEQEDDPSQWDDNDSSFSYDMLKTEKSDNKIRDEMLERLEAVQISGDDYNLDWLFSVTQKSWEYRDKKKSPSHCRKLLRKKLDKEINTTTDKGKGLLVREEDYSSGSSVGGASDSELGSFGSTSGSELGF